MHDRGSADVGMATSGFVGYIVNQVDERFGACLRQFSVVDRTAVLNSILGGIRVASWHGEEIVRS